MGLFRMHSISTGVGFDAPVHLIDSLYVMGCYAVPCMWACALVLYGLGRLVAGLCPLQLLGMCSSQ